MAAHGIRSVTASLSALLGEYKSMQFTLRRKARQALHRQ